MLTMPTMITLMACGLPPTPQADVVWANDFLGPTVKLPDGSEVNAAAHYWTDVVGVPFRRDAQFAAKALLDLNLDRTVDVTFIGDRSLPGGILSNPRMFGLVPTPDDPAGKPGKYSVSTGFLGVREELDPQTGQGTGRFGFNCWLCHGSADTDGRIVLGVPNTNIYLGLIMALSSALDANHVISLKPGGPPIAPDELRRREALDESFQFDVDGNKVVTIDEWRAVMRLPRAEETQAVLMLAGPGRLDQSIDHRMDGMIPLANLQHYTLSSVGKDEYLKQAKKSKRSVFNPVNIPGNLSGLGVSHYSWSGKDSSMRHDAVGIVTQHMKVTPSALADMIRFPYEVPVDFEALSRALTLDFRNVGTAVREADTVIGSDWSHRVLTEPNEALLRDTPEAFATVRLRELLLQPRPAPRLDEQAREGERLFTERVCGQIINQRVVLRREARTPPAYEGIGVLAPLDRSKPIDARIPVRCATCHNHSPLAHKKLIATPLNPLQRCDVCHLDHPPEGKPDSFVGLSTFMLERKIDSVDGCLRCHDRHPDFGPQAYSNSWLLPFDANGNAQTHADELADGAAGGIGTDAYLNLETLFVVQLRPPDLRPEKMYLIADNAKAVPKDLRFSTQGYGWVRVAPLVSVGATAAYLHNGSVPTLLDLMSEPSERPTEFPVGLPEQGFTFDTLLPGNTNAGHRFGTDWTAEEKAAVVSFLKAIP